MKPEPNHNVDRYRIQDPRMPRSEPGWNAGLFLMPRKSGDLRIMASDGSPQIPWEHVSVSLNDRCPTWHEMCIVKRLFWDEDEMVVQFHPPKDQYVNNHPYCLHLWKPKTGDIPMPPSIAVGFRSLNQTQV